MAALTAPAPQLPASSQENITGLGGDTEAMDGAAPDEVAMIGSTTPTATHALMAMLKAPFSSPFTSSIKPLLAPEQKAQWRGRTDGNRAGTAVPSPSR